MVSGPVLWPSLDPVPMGKDCSCPGQKLHAADATASSKGLCEVSCRPSQAAGVWERRQARQEVESGSPALFPGWLCLPLRLEGHSGQDQGLF